MRQIDIVAVKQRLKSKANAALYKCCGCVVVDVLGEAEEVEKGVCFSKIGNRIVMEVLDLVDRKGWRCRL